METLTDKILYRVIKKRPAQSHKGTFGRVLIVGGNEEYGGAAILAASSAVYAGAGLVTVASAPKNHTALHARLPEAMVLDFQEDLTEFVKSADVVVLGCGLGLTDSSRQAFRQVLANVTNQQFLIIDGSAITLFAEEHVVLTYPERTIFTPHEMELQRLSKLKIPEQTTQNLQEFVDALGSIVVAKSHQTRIFAPKQTGFLLTIGTPAQATGGMGDTLAGLIGGFLAQFHKDSTTVVAAATYLHSYIAREIAQQAYVALPSQLISRIPQTMKAFESL